MWMLERIDHLKTLDVFPTIEYGTAAGYIDWLRKNNLSNLPVWKDELYLEYHQGTYTTQAKMKEWNRRSEVLMTNAEKFSTISTMFGGTYNRNDLEEAWRSVLFNQFHDLLPGSGIRENYIDAAEKYKAVEAIGSFELRKAFNQIAKQVNTASAKNGAPVVVFNSLGWERNDIGVLQLPEGDNAEYALYDAAGKPRNAGGRTRPERRSPRRWYRRGNTRGRCSLKRTMCPHAGTRFSPCASRSHRLPQALSHPRTPHWKMSTSG